MEFGVPCPCGKVQFVTPGQAGSSIVCECGQTIEVPSLRKLRGLTDAPEAASPDEPKKDAPVEPRRYEVYPPTQASMRLEGQRRSSIVEVALSVDAIWIQSAWETQKLPLDKLSAECRGKGSTLEIVANVDGSTEKRTITFGRVFEANRWLARMTELKTESTDDLPPIEEHVPDGVSLVRDAPRGDYERLGRVSFTGDNLRSAKAGVQLRAAMRGADAVIDVVVLRAADIGRWARRITGSAVRVEDAELRTRLRRCWLNEEVLALSKHMLALISVQALVLLLVSVFCAGKSTMHAATGETPQQAVLMSAMWIGVFFTWPAAMVLALRLSKSPRMLRIAGLSVWAATSGRGLAAMVSYAVAGMKPGASVPRGAIWIFFDPVDLAFIVYGFALFTRAWRLAREEWPSTTNETSNGGGLTILKAITAAYAIAFCGFVAYSAHEIASYLFQPGVDPKLEQQALLAFNTALEHDKQGRPIDAERSYEESLQNWEKLNAQPNVPRIYRINLAMTHYNLAVIRHKPDRLNEAMVNYERVVKIADELGNVDNEDAEIRRIFREARAIVSEHRDYKVNVALEAKNKKAWELYDEANIASRKGEAAAEPKYLEAIAIWEEVVAKSTNDTYVKSASATIAHVYLELAELQELLGKYREAEQSAAKAVQRGEKALALGPDRPLVVKDNLERARSMVDRMHERMNQAQLDKLFAEKRYADAQEQYMLGIKEWEDRFRADKSSDPVKRMLAYKLDRFAWFLAHCPDARIRDTKAAVKHARRAADLQPAVGDFWYTLAMVQYRNGEWHDCRESLDQLKEKERELDGPSLFLLSMTQHQLKQIPESKATFRKAQNWVEDRKRQAESDPVKRLQFELQRPAIDLLRREAEFLLEGKDPSGDKVG